MRTDPTDTGGLFVSRRPGTRPVRYRDAPQRRKGGRRVIDSFVAAVILVFEGLVACTFWGPIPMAWLWIGAQVKHHTGSISLFIVVAFLGMLLTLLAGLALMRRIDNAWILVRRAAGHDQRKGAIGPVFAVAAVVGVAAFTIWLVFIAGLSPSPPPTRTRPSCAPRWRTGTGSSRRGSSSATAPRSSWPVPPPPCSSRATSSSRP